MKKGVIALMGSGELTATMVEVHKELLRQYTPSPQAVFIDTPAGFQLNVDEISERAKEYFSKHIEQPIITASFRSSKISDESANRAFLTLQGADYVMIGPGSPTYAVKQWKETPIPRILKACVEKGGTLVAASAAALTVGRFTLPVYEIYKVGEDLYWEEGLDILGQFGIQAVVVPHWNNAEGGTHDTRFCYMGEPRFNRLESLLTEDLPVIGLDEHTACLLDLEKRFARVRGIGRVVLRCRGDKKIFTKGHEFSFDEFYLITKRGRKRLDISLSITKEGRNISETGNQNEDITQREGRFWSMIHDADRLFQEGLEKGQAQSVIKGLLDLDAIIWIAKKDLENEEFISQAREILREKIVLLGINLLTPKESRKKSLLPLVESLLKLRKSFRENNRWEEADDIRSCLEQAGVMVEDTESGWRWYFKDPA